MTSLGSQLIELVALEFHQNGNGVILGFLSRECICVIYLVYTRFVSLGHATHSMKMKLSCTKQTNQKFLHMTKEFIQRETTCDQTTT